MALVEPEYATSAETAAELLTEYYPEWVRAAEAYEDLEADYKRLGFPLTPERFAYGVVEKCLRLTVLRWFIMREAPALSASVEATNTDSPNNPHTAGDSQALPGRRMVAVAGAVMVDDAFASELGERLIGIHREARGPLY